MVFRRRPSLACPDGIGDRVLVGRVNGPRINGLTDIATVLRRPLSAPASGCGTLVSTAAVVQSARLLPEPAMASLIDIEGAPRAQAALGFGQMTAILAALTVVRLIGLNFSLV